MFPTVPRCFRRSICTSATLPSSRTATRVSRSEAETRSAFGTRGVYAGGSLDVHVRLDRDVEDEQDDENRPAAVARVPREGQRACDEEAVEREKDRDAHEPPLLGERREDEVGVADGQETEPALGSLLPALAEDAARADRDSGLPDLVARAPRGEVRIEERADPVLLVVLQEEPRPSDGERRRHDEDGPPAPGEAAEEERREEERQIRERDAEVRLQHDENHRHSDGRYQRPDRSRAQESAVVVLEDPREEKRDRDARELRGLELEPAAHLEPRLRPDDPLAEDREEEKHEEREPVKARRVLQEDAVVDREEDAGGDEAEDREKNLLAGEIPARSSRGCRDDHRDADRREGEREKEDAQVDPPGEDLGQPRHRSVRLRSRVAHRARGERREQLGLPAAALGDPVLREARRERSSDRRSVLAVLHEDDDDDFRVVLRREAREPAVIAQLLGKEVTLLRFLLSDDLNGTGLAAEIEAGHARGVRGTTGHVHDAPEALDDRLVRAGRVRDRLLRLGAIDEALARAHVLADMEEVRRRKGSVRVRDAGHAARDLQRGH